ncbi:MAG: tetratricopeptide repeat protein, partial [Bryobacteraceae bacterium]
LNRAIQLDPKFAEAHYNLGAALWFGGQRAKASAELKGAAHLDPAFLQAYLFLGMALSESGEFATALDSLSCALSLNPNLFPAYVDQGIVLLRLGRLRDGLAERDQGESDPLAGRQSFTYGFAGRPVSRSQFWPPWPPARFPEMR